MPGNETEVRKNLQQQINIIDTEEYRRSLKQEDLARFNTFLNSLKSLNDLTDKFYRTDWYHRDLDKDSYRSLMESYTKALSDGKEIQSSKKIPKALKKTVLGIQDLLNKDYGELSNLAAQDELISLPMAIDRARGLNVVSARGSSINTVGGAVSSRMKVSVLNSRGQRVDGFFTTHTNLDPVENLRQSFVRLSESMDKTSENLKKMRSDSFEEFGMSQQYFEKLGSIFKFYSDPKNVKNLFDLKMDLQNGPEKLSDYCQKFKKKNHRDPDFLNIVRKAPDWYLEQFDTELRGFHEKDTEKLFSPEVLYLLGVDEEDSAKFLQQIKDTDPEKNKDLQSANGPKLTTPYELMMDLSKVVDGIRIQNGIYKDKLQVADGNNITRRNCAFSTLAGLTGISSLIATAHPMTIQQDGKVLEGVFMENAKGVTTGGINANHPMGDMDPDEFVTPEAKKEVAAVQILDTIGLNADRHVGNFSYILNEKGQLAGVQCFDNDASFGERVPNDNEKTHVLAALDNVKVIPEDMAQRLQALTPEMLHAALRPDLTDKEIDATWSRIEKVKNGINNHKIRVVKDDEWKDLSMKDLALMNDEDEKLYYPQSEKLLDEKTLANRTEKFISDKTKNGGRCKNIFETILVTPTKVRARKREAINNTRAAAEKAISPAANDKVKKEELRNAADRLTEAKFDEAMAQTEIDRLLPDDKNAFADAQQSISAAGVNSEDNITRAKGWLNALGKKPEKNPEFQKPNQEMKEIINGFIGKKKELKDEASYKEYRKELRSVAKQARAYLTLRLGSEEKTEAILNSIKTNKKVKDPVVKTLGEMVVHLDQQSTMISSALKADRQRIALQTMDLVNSVKKNMDSFEKRAEDPAYPEYLKAYGKDARSGLEELIGLSAKDFGTMDSDQKEAFYNSAAQAAAKMAVFEQAESNYKNKVDPDLLAQHGNSDACRLSLADTFAKKESFRQLLGIANHRLQPEHLAALCAKPDFGKELMINSIKLDQAYAKRQKAQEIAAEETAKLNNMKPKTETKFTQII